MNGSGTSGSICAETEPVWIPPPWKRRQEALERRLADGRRSHVDCTVGGHGSPHVYFAYSAGRIKIGTSLYPKTRGQRLSTQSPHPVTVILTIPGGADIEARFHELLAGARKHGEWFCLSKEMRWLLQQTLCRTGVSKFKKAEAEFQNWLKEMDQ